MNTARLADAPSTPEASRIAVVAKESICGEGGIRKRADRELPAIRVDSRAEGAPRVDVSARSVVDVGPSVECTESTPTSVDVASIESVLVTAIASASAAGRWDVVAQLAKELEARRLGSSNVVALEAVKARRGRP